MLADDSVIVREGVRAMLAAEPDLEVVGVAGEYDEVLDRSVLLTPHVLVTDIRMPPSFQREGVDAAKAVRQRLPGTGIVILSQYDEPEYAIALLSDGADGYAYLLKDRIGDGDQLVRAVREVAAGRSLLDETIVERLVRPVSDAGDLAAGEERLLRMVAEGKTIKAIAAARRTTASAAAEEVEDLFLTMARQASSGSRSALRRLRQLHEAIVEREEHGDRLSRFLPGGVAATLRKQGHRIGAIDTFVVTVLMSDVRGYSVLAEASDPRALAGQLQEHREQMTSVITGAGGTIMQFAGDSVLAVFGAPFAQEDHAARSVGVARAMQACQARLNERWRARGVAPFGLGIGLSTGEVAAALLGTDERVEYSIVGSTVNLAQRLQQLAGGGEIVLSEATLQALDEPVDVVALEPAILKGIAAPVRVYRLDAAA